MTERQERKGQRWDTALAAAVFVAFVRVVVRLEAEQDVATADADLL